MQPTNPEKISRDLMALSLYRHGHMTTEQILKVLLDEEKAALPDHRLLRAADSTDDIRDVKCGLCGKTVATISLVVFPFVARCNDCLP